MKYKKYALGSYNLHTIATDQFKTITIKINFKREVKKEEITKRNLLVDMLVRSSKKYSTERLMNIMVEELYGINFTGYTTVSGRYDIVSFDFTFLHEKYTEKGNFEKTLTFIYDLLFDPNVSHGKFESKSFLLSKNTLKSQIESIEEDPDRKSMMRLLEEMCEDSPASFHHDGYLEDLEKIEEDDLYKYYQKMIQKDLLDIFVIGEIDSKMKQKIESKMNIHTFKRQSKSHYITASKPRLRLRYASEEAPFNQSKLALGANMVSITPFERDYVSYVYSFILGGGSDSNLFKVVREQNSLCYYIYSQVYRLSDMLTIRCGTDKGNVKQTIALIKKEMKKMVQGKFKEEDIMKAQVTYMSSLKEVIDNPSSLLNLYVSKEYLDLDTVEARIAKIGKVNKKDVQALAKKIKLNTVYVLEGSSSHEKENTL